MNREEEELIQECLSIFSDDTGPYEMGRQLSIENLSKTGDLDDKSLMDFRKALQDIGVFFEYLEGGNISEAKNQLHEIDKNLQRTACESAKRTAQYQFEKICSKRMKRQYLYTILLFDVPNNCSGRVDRIEERIALGTEKNPSEWQRSVAYYEDASELAEELDNELPSRQEIRKQILAGIVSIISIVGATVGLLSFFGYDYSLINSVL